MGKVAVISIYKSEAIKYLVKNSIPLKDAIICCNQNDIEGHAGQCSKVEVLSSWYGFDMKETLSYLMEKPASKKRNEEFKIPDMAKAPKVKIIHGDEPMIGGDKSSNEAEVAEIKKDVIKGPVPKGVAKTDADMVPPKPVTDRGGKPLFNVKKLEKRAEELSKKSAPKKKTTPKTKK